MTRSRFTITVVLSGSQETGGGFHQSLTNLQMLIKTTPKTFNVKIVDVKGSFSEVLQTLVAQGQIEPTNVVTVPRVAPRLRDRVASDPRWAYKVARLVLGLFGHDIGVSPLARFLDTSDTDVVYFVSPSPEAGQLRVKPFVWTLWDLCHLDSPEFPEIRTYGKFEARDSATAQSLRKASLVVVDSRELVSKATAYYGVGSGKFVIVPFSPPDSISSGASSVDHLPEEVRHLAGRFFFYPAQLWTHKNHVRIAEALEVVVNRGADVHVVFTGRDHGAGPAIRSKINTIPISDRVHFLGYVPDSAIAALYKHSIALVMASYFGPTNIPPLEAMLLGVPVLASNVHSEQLGPAALFFDPDNHLDLARQMTSVLDASVRDDLIAHGTRRLAAIDDLRTAGHDQLQERLVILSRRLIG